MVTDGTAHKQTLDPFSSDDFTQLKMVLNKAHNTVIFISNIRSK